MAAMNPLQSGVRQGSRRLLRVCRQQQGAPVFSSAQRTVAPKFTQLQESGCVGILRRPVQDREFLLVAESKRWTGSFAQQSLPAATSERLCAHTASLSSAAPEVGTKEGRSGSSADDNASPAAVEEKVEPVSSGPEGGVKAAPETAAKVAEVMSNDAQKLEELQDQLEDAEEQLANSKKALKEMESNMLRNLASAQNLVERTKREAENARKFAVQGFAKDLLDVADNLSRAAAAVPKKSSEPEKAGEDAQGYGKQLQALLEGVEMTEKVLSQAFKKHGLVKYDPVGEKFDPNVHAAVFEVEDNSKEAGTVAVVLKTGYKLHDRVIRPADVGVVKAKPEERDSDADSD